MTIKESILKSLEDFSKPVNSLDITKNILQKKYCEFSGETPQNTVSAQCGDFVRKGDTRVKRIYGKGGIYLYYLSKNEQEIEIDSHAEMNESKIRENSSFKERDLHKLLCTYLNSKHIYSKTIFQERSNGRENNQMWTHPDIVGIQFLHLHSDISERFLKAIDQTDTFKMSSYELKKEIKNDSELKKAYFQAVSNSSWANYGYLVTFDISGSLYEEIERLNQSFGIGVIELNANPYQSKVLYPAHYRAIDIRTIDKLCRMNQDFENFIDYVERMLMAEKRNYNAIEKDFREFCDTYFNADSEIKNYCKEKHIPFEDNLE
jgi:hypothetical protein